MDKEPQEYQHTPTPVSKGAISPSPLPHTKKHTLLFLPVFLLFLATLGVMTMSQKRAQDTRTLAASTGPMLALSPATKNASVGDTISVGVTMTTNGDTVSAAELHLSYDPTAIQILKFTTGTPLPVILTPETHANGTISVTLGVQPTHPFKGANIVGTWTIQILAAKQSSISFTSATQVASIGKNTNSLISSTGSTITGTATTPTPTPTPTPTKTPTPTRTPTPTPKRGH